MIEVYDITNTIFTSKTYILSKKGQNTAWLVDIGDIESVLTYLNERTLIVEGLFLTHAHFDHIYGMEALMKCFPKCKVYVCDYTKQAIASEKLNMSKYYGTPINYCPDNVIVVKEGDSMILFDGEPPMEFYETPGHNPGCLTMVIDNIIFTGDAYIPEVGVTTYPPHSDKQLAKISLERILKLAENKMVCNCSVNPVIAV